MASQREPSREEYAQMFFEQLEYTMTTNLCYCLGKDMHGEINQKKQAALAQRGLERFGEILRRVCGNRNPEKWYITHNDYLLILAAVFRECLKILGEPADASSTVAPPK